MSDSKKSEDALVAKGEPRSAYWGFAQISFVALMLGLMVLFVTLGTWQVERLSEKDALLANVEARFSLDPRPFPAAGVWADIDPRTLDYSRFELTGTFDNAATALVFTNLPDPVGRYGGVGYWVMAPFELGDGGIVWVNRGFVPEAAAEDFATGGDAPEGRMTIEAVARRPEMANSFTPEPDLESRREWVRNPDRLTRFLEDNTGPIAPITVDMTEGAPGALPQGGETQIAFPNRHLEYAGTWYLFAAITPIMLGFWLWRQRRPRNLAHEDKDN
ncbi:SURF1 family protein [Pelagibacterium sp.]|uniref:SURF1 family protein n=1 Tax=Pelagibacterium sp. TaxID=1967288 RepID=UPI003A93D838